jgi:hypothetical protein
MAMPMALTLENPDLSLSSDLDTIRMSRICIAKPLFREARRWDSERQTGDQSKLTITQRSGFDFPSSQV